VTFQKRPRPPQKPQIIETPGGAHPSSHRVFVGLVAHFELEPHRNQRRRRSPEAGIRERLRERRLRFATKLRGELPQRTVLHSHGDVTAHDAPLSKGNSTSKFKAAPTVSQNGQAPAESRSAHADHHWWKYQFTPMRKVWISVVMLLLVVATVLAVPAGESDSLPKLMYWYSPLMDQFRSTAYSSPAPTV
jgi:hypothetical protein